jgi:hypothetical protein
LGFPKDTPLLAAPGRITSVDNNGRLITNSALNHGMSGGPAFNRSGAIIGIAEGGYEEANSINLLIPISYATRLLQIADSPLLNDKPSPTPVHAPVSTLTPTPTSAQPILTPTPSPTARALTQLSDISYALTTTKDPVQPGKVAQFTITVTNLTDSKAFAEFAFHVPEFTTYRGYAEGTPSSVVLGWVAPGASASANLDFKVIGGNQSPPDGSIVTLVLTDLSRGASVSHSVTTNSSFTQSGRNCASDRYASNAHAKWVLKSSCARGYRKRRKYVRSSSIYVNESLSTFRELALMPVN